MALPLGAVLCFLDLLGARVFARGEVGQTICFWKLSTDETCLGRLADNFSRAAGLQSPANIAPYLHSHACSVYS